MSKGGYTIVDFKGKNLTVDVNRDAVEEVKLIEEALKHNKPIIFSNFTLEGNIFKCVYVSFFGSAGLAKCYIIAEQIFYTFTINSTEHYLTISKI